MKTENIEQGATLSELMAKARQFKAQQGKSETRRGEPQHSDDTKSIPGYPGYMATSNGEILSVGHNWRGYGWRELKQDENRYGYKIVRLQIGDKRLVRPVHRLVLLAFRGEPSNGCEARHLNGNRKDNGIQNLAWGTRKENAGDREAHGNTARGEKHSNAIKAGLNKAKSSPLPWALEVGSEACFHKGNRVSIVRWYDCDGERCAETVAEVWSADNDSDIADGKLIVASVNNAERLAEALAQVVSWIDVGCDPSRVSIEKARAALNAWRAAQ